MLSHILIYTLSFAGIWIGTGLAIGAVERISRTLHASTFAISFLLLGFFTSISEFSVGVNAIFQNDPEIYVGNLIGASIVLFMLIIPLLAITSKKIHITHEFRGFNLPASLVLIALPVILVMDGRLSRTDSWIAIVLFAFLVIAIQTKRGLIESVKSADSKARSKISKEVLRIVFGLVTIFLCSKFVVDQTIYFSEILQLSPFVISLLLVGIGTNIPELSLVVRTAFLRNSQVAFGDYVGSAAFNTFLMGFLTLLYGKSVLLTNSYLVSLMFLILGLLLFYYFAKSKNYISRLEGMVLVLLYVIFVAVEIFIHRGSIL